MKFIGLFNKANAKVFCKKKLSYIFKRCFKYANALPDLHVSLVALQTILKFLGTQAASLSANVECFVRGDRQSNRQTDGSFNGKKGSSSMPGRISSYNRTIIK